MRELGRWQRSITQERSEYGSGGDGKSLLLIGCQTAELFTATGWRILPLYKGLRKSAACIKTQPSSRELTGTKDKHQVWRRQQLCFNPEFFVHLQPQGTCWNPVEVQRPWQLSAHTVPMQVFDFFYWGCREWWPPDPRELYRSSG